MVEEAGQGDLAELEAFLSSPIALTLDVELDRMQSARELFLRRVAQRLERSINGEVALKSPLGVEGKRAVASWINGRLRDVGLAVGFPGTGEPAILIVDRDRFRIQQCRAGAPHRSAREADLPQLKLVPDKRREEGFASQLWKTRGPLTR